MRPKTGRTHQIRVHLKYLGHPVVGDKTYAGRKTGRLDREWCPRQFLHAFYIKFTHPISKKELVFKTDLPHDLKKILKNLEEGEHGKGH
jgi:23S rRNA pseudouridine1911/1915/1917 synthase